MTHSLFGLFSLINILSVEFSFVTMCLL